MGMKTKKRIAIENFANFKKETNASVEMFYNYQPTKILSNSCGIKEAAFPNSLTDPTEYTLNVSSANINKINGVTYFKQYFPRTGNTQHRILLYGDDKKEYINQLFCEDGDLYWLYSLTFNSAPVTLSFKQKGEDAIILTSKDKMVIWKTGYSPYTIQNVPIITSMCMNDGVLFCTIREPAFKIWYATNLDAENVGNIDSNSGYVSLEDDLGNARKIVCFNQDVYVFRDYGITKINYVKNKVSVSQVYQSNTKIFTETVSVCENAIMFMTVEGLYQFNGVKVARSSVDIGEMLPIANDNACASTLGDKYYLALRLNFNDGKQLLCETGEYVNNALIVVDLTDYSYQILRGVDIGALLPVRTQVFEKMLATFNSVHTSKVGEICPVSKCFDDALPKYWASNELFDMPITRLFTKLKVVADKNVKFNLKYGNKSTSFTTYTAGNNEFCFKICAENLKLEISSIEASAQVKKVVVEYYEY